MRIRLRHPHDPDEVQDAYRRETRVAAGTIDNQEATNHRVPEVLEPKEPETPTPGKEKK